MSKADTWLPLYVNDYLGDTMHLTTEQHGAYLLLIMAAWKRGGPLPDDDGQLAGIARLSPVAWRKMAPIIRGFFRAADGTLHHGRIAKELEKAQRLSDARRESGSKGGRPRKLEESDGKPIGIANQKQNGSQTETPARVAPPSPSPEEGSVPDGTGAEAPSDGIADIRALPVAKGCWRLAVLVLVEQGGQAEAKARAFVGKLKGGGLTDDELWEIAEAAWRNETRDPVAYLTKAAEGVIARRGSVLIDAPSERQQRAWMEDWREKGAPGWRRHERGPYPGEQGCRVSAALQREFEVSPHDDPPGLIDLASRRAG